MNENDKRTEFYKSIIIICMFVLVAGLKSLGFDSTTNIVIFVLYNTAFFIYAFFRLKNLPLKLKVIVYSFCGLCAVFIGIIQLDIIPIDDINPLFIIIPLGTFGICIFCLVTYKIIKDIVDYMKA